VSEAGNILICGTNWLGDSVMSMPAIQLLKRDHATYRLTMLVKRGLVPFWRMHEAIDDLIPYDATPSGTLAASREVGGESSTWHTYSRIPSVPR